MRLTLLNMEFSMSVASAVVELGEEAINVFSPKSSVTATGNTVCPYYPAVTPPSQRIAMDIEKPGYFSYREHRPHLVITCHIFPALPFN